MNLDYTFCIVVYKNNFYISITTFFRLNDCINIYSAQFELETPAGYSKNFPESIKLNQCITAWAVLAKQEQCISNPKIYDL